MVAALFTIAYLIWQPRTVDLAAHTFRADLFGQEGFTIWNGQWYGGHHTPAYSVLSPPLAWLLTPPVALAVAAMASAALFPPLARGCVRRRARPLGRDLVRRRHRHAALHQPAPVRDRRRVRRSPRCSRSSGAATAGDPVRRACARSAARSPACSSRWPAWPTRSRSARDRAKRWEGLAIAAAAFLPPVFLSWAFPEGGWAPFPTSAYVPIPLFALACLIVLPREQAALRWGAVLYAARRPRSRSSSRRRWAATPSGSARCSAAPSSCARSGAGRGRSSSWAIAGPGRGVRPLALLAVVARGARREEVHRGPGREVRLLRAAARVPVPRCPTSAGSRSRSRAPTGRAPRSRWTSRSRAAGCASSTRGLNPIFYKGHLTPLTYASWLADNAVRYVALPSAKPDKSSYGERALIEKGLPYLRLRWKSDDWRVYEVLLPAPLVIPQGDARIVARAVPVRRAAARREAARARRS